MFVCEREILGNCLLRMIIKCLQIQRKVKKKESLKKLRNVASPPIDKGGLATNLGLGRSFLIRVGLD